MLHKLLWMTPPVGAGHRQNAAMVAGTLKSLEEAPVWIQVSLHLCDQLASVCWCHLLRVLWPLDYLHAS